MNGFIYRVILRVGYNDAYFEFADSAQACSFAATLLEHAAGCDDTKKKSYITIKVVDVAAELAEKAESEEK